MIALGALLLLAAQAPEPPVPSETQQVAALAFAPPLDRPLTYRVATRRLSRDGSFTSFALVYDLRWQRVGRGYQLLARIDRVESDAHPEVVRTLRLMIDPLIGETLTYFVPADGSSVDMVDPDGLWRRVVDRAQALAESSDRPEAKQAAPTAKAITCANATPRCRCCSGSGRSARSTLARCLEPAARRALPSMSGRCSPIGQGSI